MPQIPRGGYKPIQPDDDEFDALHKSVSNYIQKPTNMKKNTGPTNKLHVTLRGERWLDDEGELPLAIHYSFQMPLTFGAISREDDDWGKLDPTDDGSERWRMGEIKIEILGLIWLGKEYVYPGEINDFTYKLSQVHIFPEEIVRTEFNGRQLLTINVIKDMLEANPIHHGLFLPKSLKK